MSTPKANRSRPLSVDDCFYLRQLRVAKGLSLRQLGRLLGVSGVAVCRWEWGLATPLPAHLAAWRAALTADGI